MRKKRYAIEKEKTIRKNNENVIRERGFREGLEKEWERKAGRGMEERK